MTITGLGGLAALTSSLEDTTRFRLALFLFVVMGLCIFSVIGGARVVRTSIKQSLFDTKIRPITLRQLGLRLSEIENLHHTLQNTLFPRLREVTPANNIQLGAANALLFLQRAISEEVQSLLPRRYGHLATTTEFYRALRNLCALLEAIGELVTWYARELESLKDFHPNPTLVKNYDSFKQKYQSAADAMGQFVKDVELKLGRPVNFEPEALPPLIYRQ